LYTFSVGMGLGEEDVWHAISIKI